MHTLLFIYIFITFEGNNSSFCPSKIYDQKLWKGVQKCSETETGNILSRAKLMKYVWIEKNNTGSFYCIPSTVFKLFLYEN